MTITEVRVRKVKQETGKLRAIASITIDNCFTVHDIKIFEGAESLHIAMPSRKTAEGGYKDVAHPLNNETRTMIQTIVLDEYAKLSDEE
ncbi:MAG: septation regulator SpoVG [Clostridia bacterium]|nr:septation regulator SpoVG [Clostridia bacterium]